MTEAHREHLSAFTDGELEFDQVRFLLRRIEHDGHLRAAWSSYHVSRACLRGEFAGLAEHGFADRVMAALDTVETAETRHVGKRWLRWSAGGAIAASVAVVALMAARPQTQEPRESTRTAVATAAPAPDQSVRASRGRAPEVPLWLAASPAGQLSQPASATVLNGQVQGDTLIPAAYSRRMAPYMSLRAYQAQAAEQARMHAASGRWIIRMPQAAANQAAPDVQAQP
jgi:sigma-E factor negative regulatory protein RseA